MCVLDWEKVQVRVYGVERRECMHGELWMGGSTLSFVLCRGQKWRYLTASSARSKVTCLVPATLPSGSSLPVVRCGGHGEVTMPGCDNSYCVFVQRVFPW